MLYINVDRDWYISLLKLMLLSRSADKRKSMLMRQGKAHIHVSSSGHEALMALPYQLTSRKLPLPLFSSMLFDDGKGLKSQNYCKRFSVKIGEA